MNKQVVAILPIIEGKILMQLRDFKPEIVLPGCWGFFSGSIDQGELPLQAAKRELKEELGLSDYQLTKLSVDQLTDLDNEISHSFYFQPNLKLSQIQQFEGADFALVSLEQILDKKIFSPKLNSFYPPAATFYVEHVFRLLMKQKLL